MNMFESAWLLMKAPLIDIPNSKGKMKTYLDPMDFTWNEMLYSPYSFPLGSGNVDRFIASPEGTELMNRLRRTKIDYPLNENKLMEFHNARKHQIDFSNPMSSTRSPPVYLADTSTMASRSTSYPTEFCATGRHLKNINESTCAGCYAEGVTYNYDNTARRQIQSFNDMVQDPIEYHSRLADQIPNEGKDGLPVFRYLDSGDAHSPEHLALMLDTATLNPNIIHWIPTREFGMVNKVLASRGYAPDAIPPNVRLRMSMPFRNQTLNDDWNVNLLGERGRLTPVQRRVLNHPNVLRSEVWDKFFVDNGLLPAEAQVEDLFICPKDDPKNKAAKSCMSANCLACYDSDKKAIGYINKPSSNKQGGGISVHDL
jgi:hypothetical protein